MDQSLAAQVDHSAPGADKPNHTPEFWRRIARALPDYEQRKAWLAEHGGRQMLL